MNTPESIEFTKKLINENIYLKMKIKLLERKLSLYEYIVEYQAQCHMWFHMFIIFFQDLSNHSIPSSFLALNKTLFDLPWKILNHFKETILTMTDTLLNVRVQVNTAQTMEDELKRILKEVSLEFTLTSQSFNKSQEDYDVLLKKTTEMSIKNSASEELYKIFLGVNDQGFNQIKSILNISDHVACGDFIFALKKIDLLWNMIGTVFGHTPFMMSVDSRKYLSDINTTMDTDLTNFTVFIHQYFKDSIKVIVSTSDKGATEFIFSDHQKNILSTIFQQQEATRQVGISLNIPSNLIRDVYTLPSPIERDIIKERFGVTWTKFLEVVLKNDMPVISTSATSIRSIHTTQFILKELFNSNSVLIRQYYTSVSSENLLLREFLKYLAIMFVNRDEYIQTVNKLGYNPLECIIKQFSR